jgi:hypothetical protein
MIYIISFFIVCLAMAGMALGLWLLKKPLSKGCCQGPPAPNKRCACSGEDCRSGDQA